MNQRLGQRGMVSLLTCILISMLLLVVTLSLISLEALQLRKAEDSEQTLRAYYAAEAGVEDAVSKVLSKTVTSDQTCSANTNYDIPGAAGWTCQQISFSGSPAGRLANADESKTIDPGNTSPNYQSVMIEWNQSAVTTAAQYNVNLGSGFPTAASYGTSYAAPPIELQIVEYPQGGFASNQVCTGNTLGIGTPAGCTVKLQNALITPGGSAASGVVDYGTGALYHPVTPLRGNCTRLPRGGGTRDNPYTTGGYSDYNCYALIANLPAAPDYLFRIRSRYLATNYKFTFFPSPNGLGNPVKVPDGTATIDVTAKAGQTYRRVISKLPLSNGAAAGLNFVMYSDTDLCKNFDVFNNAAQTGCPYL